MIERDYLWDYWRNNGVNKKQYGLTSKNLIRSEFLLSLFIDRIPKDMSILELGCNVGRNLSVLHNAGYAHLFGIEINWLAAQDVENAIVSVGSIESILPIHAQVDVIFTMAVLMHIHPESEWLFPEMVAKTRNFIITIEDGMNHRKTRLISRDYPAIFMSLGMKHVMNVKNVPGMNGSFSANVFQKESTKWLT